MYIVLSQSIPFRYILFFIASHRCCAVQAKTLQAENSSLRQRQRSLEVLQLERDELSRQLDGAKDDLLREQKQGRLHREEMAEVRLVLAFWGMT